MQPLAESARRNRISPALLILGHGGNLQPHQTARNTVVLIKAEVKAPGSRGGRWYWTEHNTIKYGKPPAGARLFHGVASRQQAARRRGKSGLFAGERIEGPADTAAIFRDVVDLDRERFWAVHLDRNDRPTAVECISQGSLTSAIVHPREVFKNAKNMKTAALALVHNHPSGDATPSQEDFAITRRCVDVGAAIGVPIKHHVVVGRDGYVVVDYEKGTWNNPWQAVPPTGRRSLSEIEGHHVAKPVDHQTWGDVLEQRLGSSLDVVKIGMRLLDPGEQTALALILDNKHVVTGVFPIASQTIGYDDLNHLAEVAIANSAAAVVVACGQDGPEWQQGLEHFHKGARLLMNDTPGIRYLDTVSIGSAGTYRSLTDEGK